MIRCRPVRLQQSAHDDRVPELAVSAAEVCAQSAFGVESGALVQIAHSVGAEIADWFTRHGGPWRDSKGYPVLTANT